MQNPWDDLPHERPWVLPVDRPHVDAFNRHIGLNPDYVIDSDLFPEPCLGNREAPVVVLNRNPGIGENDPGIHCRPEYIAALRANLTEDPRGHRLVGLLPQFQDTPAARWLKRLFRALFNEGHSPEDLARQVLLVEFHGYHAKSWRPFPITLPSQSWGFSLVEQAISREATIVVMRGRRDWEIAVPALHGYQELVEVRSPQTSALSPRNCEPFDLVRQALSHA